MGNEKNLSNSSYDHLDIFRGDITRQTDQLCGEELKAPCKVGRFCGSDSPGRILSELKTEEQSNLILQFKTDYTVRRAGFKFLYKQIGKGLFLYWFLFKTFLLLQNAIFLLVFMLFSLLLYGWCQ